MKIDRMKWPEVPCQDGCLLDILVHPIPNHGGMCSKASPFADMPWYQESGSELPGQFEDGRNEGNGRTCH